MPLLFQILQKTPESSKGITRAYYALENFVESSGKTLFKALRMSLLVVLATRMGKTLFEACCMLPLVTLSSLATRMSSLRRWSCELKDWVQVQDTSSHRLKMVQYILAFKVAFDCEKVDSRRIFQAKSVIYETIFIKIWPFYHLEAGIKDPIEEKALKTKSLAEN